MFFYTIIPLEYIFEEDDEEDPCVPRENAEYEITRGGVSLMVSSVNGGQRRISRIISTDPRDFLNPGLQPGSILPES